MENMNSSKKHTDWNALRDTVYNNAVNLGYHEKDIDQTDERYMLYFITGIISAVEEYEECMNSYNDFRRQNISYTMAQYFAGTIMKLLDYAGMKKIELNPDKFIPYISNEVSIHANCYAVIDIMVRECHLNQFSQLVNAAISDIMEIGKIEHYDILKSINEQIDCNKMLNL